MKKYCIYLHYYSKNDDNGLDNSKVFLKNSKDSELSIEKATDKSNLFIDSYFNCIDKVNQDKQDLLEYMKNNHGLNLDDIHYEYKIIEWRGNAEDTISQLEKDFK